MQDAYLPLALATLFPGDGLSLLCSLPDRSVRLLLTSPPYNVGKAYERRSSLDAYLEAFVPLIRETLRVLVLGGSVCWQVGSYVNAGEVVPLDLLFYPLFRSAGLTLRNRVVWSREGGLHASRRFSGRHEAVLWFTLGDDYLFNLDAVRVPQKYPGKRAYKGAKLGEYSGHPGGKNPSDVWDIPAVGANHPERTGHPAQFPVELPERFVLSLTNPGDLVVDPFLGSGTTACAALLHGRRAAGAEILPGYRDLARRRMTEALHGVLRVRESGTAVADPQDSPGRGERAPGETGPLF